MPNLLFLFAFPFIASILFLVFPEKFLKKIAFTVSLFPLFLLAYSHTHWIGAAIDIHWFQPLAIHFHLAVDPLSLIFLFLTALIIPFSILAVQTENCGYPRAFFGLIFLLEGLLIGFFTARDLVFFTLFWESMLLPLYFIINLWGGKDRQNASIQFLVYMIGGSALMVAAVLALYFAGGSATFDIKSLSSITLGSKGPWICAAFLLAFAVKTPLFPFHAWLPDAYCQAPLAGTILLSSLLSKAGIYGLLRIAFEFFPAELKALSPLLLGLAIAGVLYGAFAAWMQDDFKRLIAYSSFSHVNFVLAGLFVVNETAHMGAIVQAINHGITIAALFLAAGWLEERLNTTSMEQKSGLGSYMPRLCWITLLFVLSSVAIPGTNNFIGEILILLGAFYQSSVQAFLLGLTVILSVVYMLRFMQTIYFGTPSQKQKSFVDLSRKEMITALPLVILILWIGIYPAPLLKLIQPAANQTSVASLEK